MNVLPEVEILLVEDNPNDVDLTLRALKSRNLANQVFVARDGAEALEFFFGEDGHPLRDIGVTPRVILLDLKLPKVMASRCCGASRAMSARARCPWSCSRRPERSPTSPRRTASGRTVTSSSPSTSRPSRARYPRSGCTGSC